MAYTIQYTAEFKDLDGIDWKIDIEEDAGDPVDGPASLTCTGNPLNFEFNSTDDVFNPLHDSKASFSVYSETQFALQALYATEDLQFRVKIYEATVLYWVGFIVTDDYTEPYEMPPYPVTIKAQCGLRVLENILYDDSGTYYNGRRYYSQIFLDILGKIEHTEFTEIVNVYEEGMDVTASDSPLDQSKLDVDLFKDMYCDEVLKEALKPFNAVIVSEGGYFRIYRPEELAETTAYARHFTGVSTKTDSSFTPLQYINRSTHVTVRNQYVGGVLMTQRPASTININQDYGNKPSLIDNYQFIGETFDGTDFDNWTRSSGTILETMTSSIGDDNNGVTIDNYDLSVPPYSYYIYQEFVPLVRKCTDTCVFEFDYLLYNATDTEIAAVWFGVSLKQTNIWLQLDGTWSGDPADTWLLETTVASPGGSSGWQHIRIEVNNSPNNIVSTNEPLTIYLACTDNANVKISYKDIKFYFASETISKKKSGKKGRLRISGGYGGAFSIYRSAAPLIEMRTVSELQITENSFSIDNSINGKVIPCSYIIGDVADATITNVLEQFAGAISISTVLASGAEDFVSDHASDYTAGGVLVTSVSSRVVFTSDTAGTAFTGATTITNTSGDLTGSVVATQANVVAVAQIDKILLSGINGACEYGTELGVKEVVFDTDLDTTADTFVTDHAAALLSVNDIVVTKEVDGSDIYLVFTSNTVGSGFTTDINNTSGSLSGVATTTTPNTVAKAQITTIELSGATGGANILCDGVTQAIAVGSEIDSYTTKWNTYYIGGHTTGSESKPLLEIIGDEIAEQYSRPKQLIQMPIEDTGSAVSAINILGSFQDDLNKYGGNNRKFVFNRGDFDVLNRKWQIDLMEII